jgi:tripartite-type tricarboxylate transporter receptor subunit TctC
MNLENRMKTRVLHWLAAAAWLSIPAAGIAQSYPTKAIRVVSNSASGSPGDVALRLVAPKVSDALGQPVVVETKGGGGGQIAAQDVMRAGPDGYTIMYSTSMIVTSKYLLKNVTVDVMRDFVPISMAARVTNLLAIHSSVPVGSVKELVDFSKRNPGKLSFSSNGIGSSLHLQWIGFMVSTGADMFHVPYGSANEAIRNNDFLTGRTSASFIPYNSIRPHLEAGKVKVLAVIGDRRYKRLPDVPAVSEAFPDYRFTLGFWGFYGPSGIAQPVVARLSGEIQKGLKEADIVSKLEGIDVEAMGNSPEAFGQLLRNYEANVAALVKAARLEPQ